MAGGVMAGAAAQRAVPAAPEAVAHAFEAPAGMAWAPVSHRLTWHRRIMVMLIALPIMLVGAFLSSRGLGAAGGVVWIGLVGSAAVLGWVVAEFGYRSWGFVERADDLLVTSGVFVRRLVVVPYGRMQYVDVTAGILEQWLGIATVRLHTAAATTDAHIPGLAAADASLLRDRLVRKGEKKTMGL
jgi:uncharacterized protein